MNMTIRQMVETLKKQMEEIDADSASITCTQKDEPYIITISLRKTKSIKMGE